MKPVAFAYERPRSIDAVTDLLARDADAKILAGGQTLGPLLNLRLVQPGLIIDITRIGDLVTVSDENDTLAIGACVTHAAIEDARVADPANGFLGRVAAGIAYRAVRTRGTIGGSLAHGDPVADWLSALLAIGAELEIAGGSGRRRIAVRDFVRGALETDLGPDELVTRIFIPKAGETVRHGFHKICRKTGEFADAIGAVMLDEATGSFCLVAAAPSEPPRVFDKPGAFFKHSDPFDPGGYDMDMAIEALSGSGAKRDDYEVRLCAIAMGRALEDAHRS